MTRPRFTRLMIAILSIGFAAIVAYWSVWFLGDRSWVSSLDTRLYYAFENSFPIADGWLAVTYAAAAWTLHTRRPSAMLWLLAAGSASLYLGFMDTTFDLENGVYAVGELGAVIAEVIINIASFAIGVYALWFGWAHRRAFVA